MRWQSSLRSGSLTTPPSAVDLETEKAAAQNLQSFPYPCTKITLQQRISAQQRESDTRELVQDGTAARCTGTEQLAPRALLPRHLPAAGRAGNAYRTRANAPAKEVLTMAKRNTFGGTKRWKSTFS